MASVKDHYDQHLGQIYAWMVGGSGSAFEQGAAELDAIGVTPSSGGVAVDLGTGFGLHAIPLARRGFKVLAIDSCAGLLDELRPHRGDLAIQVVRGDVQSFPRHVTENPNLVLCMGDTLTHLVDEVSVARLIATVSAEISVGGRFIISMRDYSVPLIAERRFIPVRSDTNQILTCFLEYEDSHVTVHDVLHKRERTSWKLAVSTYKKLRISPKWLVRSLQENGFAVKQEVGVSGMVRFIAQRL